MHKVKIYNNLTNLLSKYDKDPFAKFVDFLITILVSYIYHRRLGCINSLWLFRWNRRAHRNWENGER